MNVRSIGRRAAAVALAAGMLGGAAAASGQTGAVEQRGAPRGPAADILAEVLAGPEARITDAALVGAETRWFRRKALVASGDAGGAALAARELLDYAAQRGIGRLPAIARAALLEGRRHAARGRPTFAVESFRLARGLDPFLAQSWFEEAAIAWDRGEKTRAARLWWDGLEAAASRPLAAVGAGARALRLALLAAVLTGAGIVIALLFLHGPRLAGAIGGRLPARWHPAWRATVGWLVILAPLCSFVLGPWALVAWAVMLVPALGPRERLVVWAWLALLVAVPPVGRAVSAIDVGLHDDPVEIALAAAERRAEPGLVADLALIAGERREQALWPLLIARLCAREYPDRAVQLLREAAAIAPADARIRIMLGNIFYRMGKHEAAGVLYREAAGLDPGSALALLNLARVRLAAFEFDKADALARRAREADPAEYADLVAVLDEDEVGDPVLLPREIVGVALADFVWPRARAELTGLHASSLAALAALLAAFALARPGYRLEVRRCATCGSVAGGPAADDDPWERCSACRQLFSGLESLAPAARDEQSRKVARFLRRRTLGRALAQLAWPGLALVHDGRPLLGAMMAFVAASCGLATLSRLIDPAPAWFAPGVAGWIPFAAAWSLVWLLAQLPGLRPRAAGTEWSR
ncbi:MAG: tetratricopeptide repeat protein [Acidobacteria bacterium]|nr:MAG: tetratricopeptide repeat protein [Acidobacteriota bacterium]